MRFSDITKPALQYEEAAMRRADIPTLSSGAALNMVRACRRENIETTAEVTVPAQQQTARNAVHTGQESATRRNRAALCHVIRNSF